MKKNNKTLQKGFLKVMGDEKRQAITVPLFAILLSLIVGAVIIAALGKNPFEAYTNLLQGSGLTPKASYPGRKSMLTDFMSFINAWVPLMLAALSVAVGLKGGLFNIGVAGQMLTAGFLTSITIGYSNLPAAIAMPLVVVMGMTIGCLIGAFVGFLKHRFNINEVVSTIMINYIAQYIISFFINTFFVNPSTRQSKPVSDASRLTKMDTLVGELKMDIPFGIIIALLAVAVIYYLLNKTTLGYEVKAVGASQSASRYAGINVGQKMVMTMALSGALAGLAGVTYYMGYLGSIQPKVLPATGFDSIAVAILANSNPVGIIFSSFLISVISKGSTYMTAASGVEAEIASVITGIILLFSACGTYIQYRIKRMKDSLEEQDRGDK